MRHSVSLVYANEEARLLANGLHSERDMSLSSIAVAVLLQAEESHHPHIVQLYGILDDERLDAEHALRIF